MELVWIIYLIEVVTNIEMWGVTYLLGILTVTTVGWVGVSCIYALENKDVYFKDLIKIYFDILKRKLIIIPALLVFGFGSLFNSLIPSKDTAYLMLGAYGVQSVAETVGKNEEAQKIGKSTLKLINSAIEKYQKELDSQSEKPVDTEKK